jgi:hypothetical protein
MNYLPRLALNFSAPDLTSQVARIIGVSHQHPAIFIFNVAFYNHKV